MDKEILDQVNIDVAWDLVEEYSKFPRWKPDDVNKSCKLITDKLEKFGIKHKVYEPDLYLSVPLLLV